MLCGDVDENVAEWADIEGFKRCSMQMWAEALCSIEHPL